jgi:UDP-N-acetyl-D-glucosamine dehydrogenase
MKYKDKIIENNKKKSSVIGVIGLGYVGIPLSLSFVKAGFKVIGFDTNKKKIEQIKKKKAIFGQSALKILVTHYQKALIQQ